MKVKENFSEELTWSDVITYKIGGIDQKE